MNLPVSVSQNVFLTFKNHDIFQSSPFLDSNLGSLSIRSDMDGSSQLQSSCSPAKALVRTSKVSPVVLRMPAYCLVDCLISWWLDKSVAAPEPVFFSEGGGGSMTTSYRLCWEERGEEERRGEGLRDYYFFFFSWGGGVEHYYFLKTS